MTAITTIYLWCDFLRCNERYNGVDVWSPASAVRREAAKAGWTAKPVSHGRRFTKDYCPAHPGGVAGEGAGHGAT